MSECDDVTCRDAGCAQCQPSQGPELTRVLARAADNEPQYLAALEQARTDLAEAERRQADVVARQIAVNDECRKLARLVVSLSALVGEKPPLNAVNALNAKTGRVRRPYRRRVTPLVVAVCPPVEPQTHSERAKD